MTIRFDDQVVVITGAAHGLGRSHALEFARRGARVVVNDLGGARDGVGESSEAAAAVVAEIEAAGGQAMANGASVADRDAVAGMVTQVIERWGRIDVLINNAGILRDKTFSKMSMEDFDTVVAVHQTGTANCTHAVWPHMCEQQFGRIVMTSSASGIYGNFGQSNYGAAKMGVVGLMNTLAQEGSKYNIRVNTLAPVATTRMTEELFPPNVKELLKPELVTPAVIFMSGADAPTRQVISAGGGAFARVVVQETPGAWLPNHECDAEHLAAAWDQISGTDGALELQGAGEQTMKFLQMAATNLGIDLS